MSSMHSRNVIERRVYSCWAIVEPAPDVKGKWVAHCLNFDTLSQADDVETATKLLIEATGEVVLEDLQEGLNPEDRRAPDEDWAVIEQLVDASAYESFDEIMKKVGSESRAERGRWVIGCQFMLICERQHVPESQAKAFYPIRARRMSSEAEPACA